MDHLDPALIDDLRDRLDRDPDPAARAARLRLDAGTFGLCARCGDEIDAELLTEAPSRGLCAPCADHHHAHQQALRHGICGLRQR